MLCFSMLLMTLHHKNPEKGEPNHTGFLGPILILGTKTLTIFIYWPTYLNCTRNNVAIIQIIQMWLSNTSVIQDILRLMGIVTFLLKLI